MRNQDHTQLPRGRDIPLLLMGIIGIVFPLIVFSPFIVFIIILIGGAMQANQQPQKRGQQLSKEEQFDDWYNNIRR